MLDNSDKINAFIKHMTFLLVQPEPRVSDDFSQISWGFVMT